MLFHPVAKDRRLVELIRLFQSSDVTRVASTLTADPFNSAVSDRLQHTSQSLRRGRVVYVIPALSWYRVQLDGDGATIACCAAASAGFVPFGPHSCTPIPAGSDVLVWHDSDRGYGIIMGSFPSPVLDPRLVRPDFVVTGGGVGYFRNTAFTTPGDQFASAGGVLNFSAGRPVDGTSLDWTQTTETGLAIHLDPFLTYMRVDEQTGVFFSYIDQFAVFAGQNSDWRTAASERQVRNDEGEVYDVTRRFVYPWESLGLYAPAPQAWAEFKTIDALTTKAVGLYDLPDSEVNASPVARVVEFGGYLGQGGRRVVVVPATRTGRQLRDGDAVDYGVFEESISLAGAYVLRAAESLTIGKRVIIPVPTQRHTPEDGSGDDAAAKNYRFSGQGSDGQEHKLKYPAATGDTWHVDQMAAMPDTMAWQSNWLQQHPFFYHEKDWRVPQETEFATGSGPSRAQERIDFSSLASKPWLPAPAVKTLQVDHRHTGEYAERESYIHFAKDGGVVIGDGYGAEIRLSGGNITLTCPGSVELMPGKNLTVLAGRDTVLRSHRSVDISAATNDVRVKAERNLQMLGGNEATGGVLIESKASGFVADFQDKVGEDVISGGIILKANRATVATYGASVYVRTGGDAVNTDGGLRAGPIVLDAGKGKDAIIFRGSSVLSQTREGMFVGVGDDAKTVHAFGSESVMLGAGLSVKGHITATGSGSFDGFLVCSEGVFSARNTPFVGKDKEMQAAKTAAEVKKFVKKASSDLAKSFEATFDKWLYRPQAAGHDQTITAVGFSFRDDPARRQYGSAEWSTIEPRWQQMSRLGAASGGEAWEEPVVAYQGRKLQPYPGREAWAAATLRRVRSLNLFDPAAGVAKDRSVAYNDTATEIETVAPATSFRVLTRE
jgi:hypothetical protein